MPMSLWSRGRSKKREFTRMSRDSSNLARLKLVISVNRRVDRELARYRHMKELFYKAYASLELFHSVSEDLEPVDEVLMDAQSPEGTNEAIAAENPPKNPPKAEILKPVQKLRTYSQSLGQYRKETDDVCEMIEVVCRENEEKEETNAKLSADNTALRAELEVMRQESQSRAEKLQQKQMEMEAVQVQAVEMERNLSKELTSVKEQRDQEMHGRRKLLEEQKMLNVRISHLSEDLHARDEQVKSLLPQLKASIKEFGDLQKKTAFLLSRVQNLQEEAKDYQLKYKEADEMHQMQLSISGKLCNEKSELQERNAQLTLDLAQANEAVQALASERSMLETVVQGHEADKDRLQVKLQEWDRRMSDLQQVHDAQVKELNERSAQLTLDLAQANEAIQVVASERDMLRTVLQEHEAETERLQVQLQDWDRRMSDLKQVHAAQVRTLNVQISRLSEDLHAREEQVKSLLQQLKEADGLQKKAAFLLSRVQNLQEEVRDNQLKYKEADENHQMQLSISGNLCNENSQLKERSAQLTLDLAHANEAVLVVASERDTLRTVVQEHEAEEERLQVQLRERDKIMSDMKQRQNAEIKALQGEMMQLTGSLESHNAELSVVVAEKEKLTSENQQMKANEEGLHCLLREKHKENTELQQANNRQCQLLRDVATYVENAVDTAGQCARQPVRYNLRPRHRTQESATASGVFSTDTSGASTEAILSASHPPMSLPGVPQLPDKNLPKVKTEVLVPYLVQISPRWYMCAHALGVGDVAENFRQLELDPTSKCLQCLVAWIERGSEVDCSWEKLLLVLNMLQLHAVAQEIQGELWRRAFSNTP